MMFFNRNTGQKSLPNFAPDSGGASGWRGRRQSRTDETRDFNIYGDYEDEPAEIPEGRRPCYGDRGTIYHYTIDCETFFVKGVE